MVTAELINYVRGQISQGLGPESIKASLLDQKWNEADINEVFSQVGIKQSVPIPQPDIAIKPGGAWARFWASVIDSIILGIPSLLITVILAALLGSPLSFRGDVVKNIENNRTAGIVFLVLYVIYYLYLTTQKGATFGKDAYGLRVVKYKTNDLISYPKAFVRELVKTGVSVIPIIGGLIYLINGLVIIFSKEKRGFHDMIAGTQVLKVNKPWSMVKQLLIFSLIILSGVLVFGLGWFLDKNVNPNIPRSETSISTSSSNLVLAEDTLDGWSIEYDGTKFSAPFIPDKTFRETYGKGAFHPNEIRFEKKTSVSPFCIDTFTVDVQDNLSSLPIQQWQQSQQNYQGTSEQIIIDGIQSLKVTYVSPATVDGVTKDERTVSYLIPKVNKIYVLQYYTSDYIKYPLAECQNNEKALGQVFETFKSL